MRLDGVRVLDLSRLLPGPYATQLLADLGMDVIKIEDPVVGDYVRSPTDHETPGGFSPVFDAVNRGKRSVTIDLKTDEGRAVFFRLVEAADVVFEQFRPGVVDRLGVAYDDCREHNPGIVYCSLSGYGQDGPYRERVGHDLNYIGFAGLLGMTREDPGSRPVIPGYPVADMAGGVFSAFSIVSALLSRELGAGEGTYIDVSMTDAVLSFSHAVAGLAFLGHDPQPARTGLTGQYPCYRVYETNDGEYVTLAALEPKFWRNFCEAIDRPDLVEHQFAQDLETRAWVGEEVAEVFRERSRDHWEDRLGNEDVMFGPVKTVTEAFADPHISHRGVIQETEVELPRVGFPALSPDLQPAAGPPPGHGEHTTAVLREHGYTDMEIDDLRAAEII